MSVNQATLDLIESFEGFVPKWYLDPVGIWTCAYGHTDAAGSPKYADNPAATFTQAEGQVILQNDLAKIEQEVMSVVKVPLNANQYGALVSFTYNVGIGSLESSTLLKLLNAKGYTGAQNQFGRWVFAGGAVLPGLVRRRAAEAKLFGTPDATVTTASNATPQPQETTSMFSLPTIVQWIIALLPGIPDDISIVEAELKELASTDSGTVKLQTALTFAQTLVSKIEAVLAAKP